jgi:threonine dehydrogenase-like Zn-dependent dehydrogenase
MVASYPLSATLGHEFSGWLGDGTPVAVEPLDPCWECSACANGDYHRCVRGVAAIIGVGKDGGMAEECLVAPSSLVRLPAGLEVRDACLVEPLAVAVHGIRRGAIRARDRVAVVGAGAIGLCAVACARAVGARVGLAARHDAQRLAGERLGASVLDRDMPETFDVVIDAAGSSESMRQCVALAGGGARIVMLASYWEGLAIPADEICRKEIALVPAMQYNRCGPARDVDMAAILLAGNPEIAAALITHRFPLAAAAEAFAVARERGAGAIKVVLEPR